MLFDLSDEGSRSVNPGGDDAALVAQALKGGPEAFGPVVDRYKDAVFGVALSRLRNFHDAEDLTQTTFVEAFGQLDRLKDHARLGAWLRSIAIHRCLNFLKRQERIVAFAEFNEPASEWSTPQSNLERAELREQVMAAIGRLSKTQRETVTLYYISEKGVSASLNQPLHLVGVIGLLPRRVRR